MKYFISICAFLLVAGISQGQLAADGNWKYSLTDDPSYSSPTYDDAAWKSIDASRLRWEKAELATAAQPVLWTRKTLIIPSTLKKELTKTGLLALYLGRIQQEDNTYLNGKQVGFTNSGDLKRAYLLKASDILWDAPNTIAIRISHWGDVCSIGDKPLIAAARPEKVFVTRTYQEGVTSREPADKKAVYHFELSNKSDIAVDADIDAFFYDDAGAKVHAVSKKASLHPGANTFDFPYQSKAPFLKISYHAFIATYQYTAVRNAEFGYRSIAYRNMQPLVANKTSDHFEPAALEKQVIGGWLGERLKLNISQRLRQVDEEGLLAGYINQPGVHPWIGEHVGKFLEAACNAYRNSADAGLKVQIDRSAQQLIASQADDGYLGTYDAESHWTSWDVWSHKYNLVGLLAYYQLSGYAPALHAATKIGDLLATTFGTAQGQRDIIKAGTHEGMAATSVLDPMTDLYRFTGQQKYLDFCYYIIGSFNQQNGPRIISTLNTIGRVDKTANAKAYEMLSNLTGIAKLYRLTDDAQLLAPVMAAWKDITQKRLYITGTASSKEHFQDDNILPAGPKDNMGEGCVTTTWIQLNYQLLGLTGSMEFLDELERSVYNHLTGAENPQTGCVSYYTPLMGIKPYGCNITCCLSSVPRGIAMIPAFADGKIGGNPAILFYQPGVFKTTLNDKAHTEVTLETITRFPEDGNIEINVQPAVAGSFKLLLRKPYWADSFSVSVNGAPQKVSGESIQVIERTWKKGDRVAVHFTMPLRVVDGGASYPGTFAWQRGPQVLAFDKALNVGSAENWVLAANAGLQPATVRLPAKWIGGQAYQAAAEADGRKQMIVLVPYADASQTGGMVTTWMKKK